MKSFILLISCLLFFTCKEKSSIRKEIKSFNFKKRLVSSKKTKLINNGYFYSFYTQTNKDNDSIIYRMKMRSGKEGIDIFNIYEEDSQKEILLTQKMSNLLKRFDGFKVINKDSIFLFGINKVLLINFNGEIISENQLLSNEKLSESNLHPVMITNRSSPYFHEKNIYLTYLIDLPPDKSNVLYKTNVTSVFNFDNGTLFEMDKTNYPPSYFNNCWKVLDIEASSVFNKNKAIFSYPIEDTLYIHSLNHKAKIKKKEVKSKYKRKEVMPIRCDKLWDVKTYKKHSYESFLYSDLIYDNYKDIYYRICKHPEEEYNLKSKFNSLNNKFSIMVLDSNFNVISESKILNEKPKYIPFDYFINEEGLWISTSNPDNESYKEDELSFELFKLEDK